MIRQRKDQRDMMYKKSIVFSGDPEMPKEKMVEYAQACLARVSRGDVAAMHDVFYIVNIGKVPLDTIVEDPERVANHPYYNRLETLV